MTLGDGAEVRTGLYIRPSGGMSLFKVSTPYPQAEKPYTTVVVCRDGRQYPSRTLVRTLSASQLAGYETATGRMVDAYHNWLEMGNG
jgi:hypothetical protein